MYVKINMVKYMKDKLTFKLKEDGTEKEYFIIKMFTYKNNDYMIYTENNDTKDVYAAKYEIKDDELKLYEIETDDEWNHIDSILSIIGEE